MISNNKLNLKFPLLKDKFNLNLNEKNVNKLNFYTFNCNVIIIGLLDHIDGISIIRKIVKSMTCQDCAELLFYKTNDDRNNYTCNYAFICKISADSFSQGN